MYFLNKSIGHILSCILVKFCNNDNINISHSEIAISQSLSIMLIERSCYYCQKFYSILYWNGSKYCFAYNIRYNMRSTCIDNTSRNFASILPSILPAQFMDERKERGNNIDRLTLVNADSLKIREIRSLHT